MKKNFYKKKKKTNFENFLLKLFVSYELPFFVPDFWFCGWCPDVFGFGVPIDFPAFLTVSPTLCTYVIGSYK